MDRAKVEENVKLFLANGWTRGKAEEYGCPVVFKEQYDLAGNVVQQTKVFVRDDLTPKSLENVRVELVPNRKPGPIERVEPA